MHILYFPISHDRWQLIQMNNIKFSKNLTWPFCYPNHFVFISIVLNQNNPLVNSKCLIISTYLPSITCTDEVTECYVATSKSLAERSEFFYWGFILATSVTNTVKCTVIHFVFVLCCVGEGLCYELVTRSEELCGLCLCVTTFVLGTSTVTLSLSLAAAPQKESYIYVT